MLPNDQEELRKLIENLIGKTFGGR
jgi:hypothetical protein